MSDSSLPIGIFDSGVGGLSVFREIQALLPEEALIYVADQAHVPYGSRSLTEVQQFSYAISRFLLRQKVKLIVVACNTASAAALTVLRQRFPHVPFVGMEPAVKPAARQTQTGKVGVLATAGTFASERYADLMARFAQDVVVYEDPCLGLVDLIERGLVDGAKTEQLIQAVIRPMLLADVDTLVLGCTHYPFVIPMIQKLGGTAVSIIDPAPAIARQVKRIIEKKVILSTHVSATPHVLITTGDALAFKKQVYYLLGYEADAKTAVWQQEGADFTLQFSQVLL